MKNRFAFASFVPSHKVREFEILEASLNLFESIDRNRWSVRGETAGNGRIEAIEDAWHGASPEAVIYLDPGVVITSRFLETLIAIEGDVVLSPHYCPPSRAEEERKAGKFSGAFLLVRTPAFTSWWKATPDSLSLEAASNCFQVGIMGPSANIGFWRGSPSLEFPAIPQDCLCFNAQLFQPAITAMEMVKKIFAASLTFGLRGGEYKPAFSGAELTDKAFALHCVKFLRSSGTREHKILLDEILARDVLGLYAAELAA